MTTVLYTECLEAIQWVIDHSKSSSVVERPSTLLLKNQLYSSESSRLFGALFSTRQQNVDILAFRGLQYPEERMIDSVALRLESLCPFVFPGVLHHETTTTPVIPENIRIAQGVLRFYFPTFAKRVERVLENTRSPLILCGHSMGGCIAAMVAIHLILLGRASQIRFVFLLGSPKFSSQKTNEFLSFYTHNNVYSILNTNDYVTMLPPPIFPGYVTLGIPISFTSVESPSETQKERDDSAFTDLYGAHSFSVYKKFLLRISL